MAISLGMGPCHVKQGSEQSEFEAGSARGIRDRSHAPKAAEASAPDQVQEDGLGLVVGGVGDGNSQGVLFMSDAG